MNKYQEALDGLKDTKCDEINNCKICSLVSYCGHYQCVNTLQELVDKETPKKVIKETISDAYDCDDRSIDFEYEIIKCPNCNFHLVDETENWDFEDWDYCLKCGQKLDWSAEDDEKTS